MLLEAALCLALQQKELDASPDVQKGGVLTPAAGEQGSHQLGSCIPWGGLLGLLGGAHSCCPAGRPVHRCSPAQRMQQSAACPAAAVLSQPWACCWWSACGLRA